MRRLKSGVVSLVAVGLSFALANADPLVSSCQSVVDGDDETFVCQLRSTSGKELNNISVEQDDGSNLGFSSKSYNWENDKTALYFLVQSAGVTPAQLERFSSYLTRAAFPVGKQTMGIATAGTTFREVAALGSYRPELESAAGKLATLKPQDGDTIVLQSLSDAVAKLAKEKADRKAVIVLSDGDPASGKVDQSTLINQALNANVAIYFVIEGKKGEDAGRVLKTIADKTNGGIEVVTDLSDDDLLAAASRAPERIENGVKLEIDATDLPDNSVLKISASVPGEGTVTTAPIEIERQTARAWHSPDKLFGDNLFATLAALVLASGLGLLALSYFSRGGQRQPAGGSAMSGDDSSGDDETRILTQNWAAGQDASAVAWLELIDSGDKPLPLAPGSIRIGRSRDNDVQLTNRSVHRHHAILQVGDDGAVSIQDLGTKNGVFVNGSRCNECALCVDDVVELGEVKLQLVAKPS